MKNLTKLFLVSELIDGDYVPPDPTYDLLDNNYTPMTWKGVLLLLSVIGVAFFVFLAPWVIGMTTITIWLLNY